MEQICNKYKAQQNDYNELILNNLIKVADGFLANGSQETFAQLDKMEYLMLLDPHNIQAANALANTLEKTLICSSASRFSEILKEEVNKKLKLMKDFSETDGYSESKGDIASSSEYKSLQMQNESLRTTVAQLRQKLAQVTISN